MSAANKKSGQKPQVLLIDDDEEFCCDLAGLLGDRLAITSLHNGADAVAHLCRTSYDVILLDIDLGGAQSGLDVLLEIRKDAAPPPVLMLTGDTRIRTAVEAMRRGAYHYITKPPNIEELTHGVERALADQALRRRLASLERDLDALKGEIIAEDSISLQLLKQVAKVAPTEASVFITGESGTGKELVARRLHQLSLRREGPFEALACPAVPENLIESELFGHEQGAFTGACKRKSGRFELAAGGTLFLDELGESPPSLQVKLLRALETRTFTRVGGEALLHADVRVVAATNRDVQQQVAAGHLREDLYYRLNVYPIHLPPLRDRPGDILPIALHYTRYYAQRMGRPIDDISPAARRVLREHAWPGNVRQLRNAIERAVIECEGAVLDLPDFAFGQGPAPPPTLPYDAAKDRVMRAFKRDYVIARLREAGGNVTRAAEASGLPRSSFQRMMQECGADPQAFRASSP